MKARVRLACLLGIVFGLIGCASQPPKIDLNQEAAAKIDSITVIRPPHKMELKVNNLAHPGMFFGALGGLVAGLDMETKSGTFNKAMRAENFSISHTLAGAIERKLREAGYQVKVEDGAWDEKDGRYTLQTDRLPQGDGPVLIITPLLAGFVSTVSDDYMPSIQVVTRLIAKDRKTELYRGYHAAGWEPDRGEWKYAKSTTTFRNFDALMAKPAEAALALAQTADLISASIIADLRRPSTTTATAGKTAGL